MKTGLTKRQKTTCIYFDEASKTVEIQTHNTALKKRLTQYAAAYPDLCKQTDDDEQGGLTFAIDCAVFRRAPSRSKRACQRKYKSVEKCKMSINHVGKNQVHNLSPSY